MEGVQHAFAILTRFDGPKGSCLVTQALLNAHCICSHRNAAWIECLPRSHPPHRPRPCMRSGAAAACHAQTSASCRAPLQAYARSLGSADIYPHINISQKQDPIDKGAAPQMSKNIFMARLSTQDDAKWCTNLVGRRWSMVVQHLRLVDVLICDCEA